MSTTRRPSTPGISVSAPIPVSRSAHAKRTCSLRSAPGSGDIETGALRLPRHPQATATPDPCSARPRRAGRVFQPEIGIVASPAATAVALGGLEPIDAPAWSAETEQAHADYLDNLRHAPWTGTGVDMGEVMAWLRDRLPEDATITNGAGNYSVWAHRFYEFRRYGTQLAPQSGSMGYGVPAAVAAKLVHPGPDRGLPRGRRGLLDDRAGADHRRPVRGPDRRARDRQRDAGHDPDAPGAPLPRARERHRSRQPGLRCARAGRTAATASGSSARRTSRLRSSVLLTRRCPPFSISWSIPRRSHRGRRSRRSAKLRRGR